VGGVALYLYRPSLYASTQKRLVLIDWPLRARHSGCCSASFCCGDQAIQYLHERRLHDVANEFCPGCLSTSCIARLHITRHDRDGLLLHVVLPQWAAAPAAREEGQDQGGDTEDEDKEAEALIIV